MKKRMISLLLVGATLCSLLTGCTAETSYVPKFEKSEGVRFSAYSAPTVNNRITEELDDAYKKLAEAGFNEAQALYEGSSNRKGTDIYDTIEKRSEDAEKVALAALDIAEKYGIKYYVRDWSFYGLSYNYPELSTKEEYEKIIAKMFDENNQYIDHPAYGGNYGHDEPDVQLMDEIAWQVELYNKYIEKNGDQGGEIFINLLPIYATAELLSQKSDYSYTEYLDYYFEKLAPLLGYVSWDYYPFKKASDGTKYVTDNYFYNMELIAQRAKEHNCKVYTYIVSTGSDTYGLRQLENISELRYQIYANMAFGVEKFSYYTYQGTRDESNNIDENGNSKGGYAVYNKLTGEHTWLYDAAKQVNNEVHDMEDAYMAYKWDGVMFKNASEMVENQLFANLSSPMLTHDRMEIVSCTEDVLAGVFKAKDKDRKEEDAFMLVNATEPSEEKDCTVTLKFEDATSLLMYRFGEEIVVPLSKDGTYTFVLKPGEGRFVIPF